MNKNQTYLYRNEPLSSSILSKVRVSQKGHFFKKYQETRQNKIKMIFAFYPPLGGEKRFIWQMRSFSHAGHKNGLNCQCQKVFIGR